MGFISKLNTEYDYAAYMIRNGNTVSDVILYLMNDYDHSLNHYCDAEQIALDAEVASADLVREAAMCEGILRIIDRGKLGYPDIVETIHHIEGFIEGSCYAYSGMRRIMEHHIGLLRKVFESVTSSPVEPAQLYECIQYYKEEVEFMKRSAEIATEHRAKYDLLVPSPIGFPEEYVKTIRKIVGIQLYQKKLAEFKYALAVADCTENEFMQYIDHSSFSLRDFVHMNYPRKGFKKALREYLKSMPRTRKTLEEVKDLAKEKEGERLLVSILGSDYESNWISEKES